MNANFFKRKEDRNNLRKSTLRNRIIVMFMIIVSFVMLTAVFIVVQSSDDKLSAVEDDAYEKIVKSVNQSIKLESDMATSSALTIANSWLVQDLFGKRDLEGLKDLTLPIYKNVKNEFDQGQFHLPNSVSFLRLHEPEKHGDDLSSYREMVNAANKKQEIIKGVERGYNGFSLRTVVPIQNNGKHVGTFEYGVNIDDEFINKIKELYGGEYFVYEIKDGKKEKIAETMREVSDYIFVDEDDLVEELNNEKTVSRKTRDQRSNIVFIPLKNFKGENVGYIKAIYDRSHIVEEQNKTMTRLLLLTLTAAGLVMFVFLVFLNEQLKPLETIKNNANMLANGDFANLISVNRDDEIGEVALAIEKIAQDLSLIINDIEVAADDVACTSQQLTATSEEVGASADYIAQSIEEVSLLASKQNDESDSSNNKVREIGEKTNVLNERIDVVNDLSKATIGSTKKGIELSLVAEEKIDSIRDVMELTTTNVSMLSEKSRAIEEIIEVMESIADQTNLLALNATIEAARAGDAGRGFSVVADEIRKLSIESQESTQQVNEIIEGISKDIEDVVGSISNTSNEVNEGITVINESNCNFKFIAEEVEKVVEEIVEITDISNNINENVDELIESLNEIKIGSDNTLAESENVTAVSEEQTAAMHEVSESAVNLSSLAIELKDKFSNFKLR